MDARERCRNAGSGLCAATARWISKLATVVALISQALAAAANMLRGDQHQCDRTSAAGPD